MQVQIFLTVFNRHPKTLCVGPWFHLVWDRISLLLATGYNRLSETQPSRNSPFSHLARKTLKLQMRVTTVGFTWSLGAQTLVVTLACQAYYPLSHLPYSSILVLTAYLSPSVSSQVCNLCWTPIAHTISNNNDTGNNFSESWQYSKYCSKQFAWIMITIFYDQGN